MEFHGNPALAWDADINWYFLDYPGVIQEIPINVCIPGQGRISMKFHENVQDSSEFLVLLRKTQVLARRGEESRNSYEFQCYQVLLGVLPGVALPATPGSTPSNTW